MDKTITKDQKDKWRKEYATNTYLSFLSIDCLKERLHDILKNLLNFSKVGLISFDQLYQMSGLVERLIHVEEELAQRNISFNPKDEALKFEKKYQNIVKAMGIPINRKLTSGKYLVIFGKKVHFELTKRFGKIRIKPAFKYDNSDLIDAVRDDELSEKLLLPKNTKIRRKMSSGEFEEIKGVQNISVSNTYPTDFYIYCMSTTYQPRLFDDFNADACLLIYDIPVFRNKLYNYLKTYYSDWLIDSKNVKYFDPFFPKKLLSIPFNKHFRYWYQSEFRIVFKPRTPVEKLEIIYPEIGSLENCSELIYL